MTVMPIRSVRRLVSAASAAVLVLSAVVALPVGVAPASAGGPATLYLVGPVEFDEVRSVSPDGRFAVVAVSDAERSVSLPFADGYGSVAGAGNVAHDGGTFVFRVGGLHSLVRYRVATNEADEFVIPLAPGLVIERFIAANGSGTAFLIEVRSLDTNGNPFTTYLYDANTDMLIAPFGIRFGALDPGPTGRSLSADGRFVTGYASVNLGVNYYGQYLRRDVATGALVVRDEPPEAGGLFTPFPFVVSDDLAWGAFVAEEADVVPGLPAGRRLYRRNFETGVTSVVPVDVNDLVNFGVYDGGRVLLSHRVATVADPASVQLSVWDGVGLPQLLTVGTDAEPADLGVGEIVDEIEFVATRDASRVTFVSSATNLAAGATTPLTRLYQVVLPSLERTLPPRQVGADESVCVVATGALPGEYVGVNVTPVGARTGGFGVVHSSDERAGSTSNVNFGPGTVDPNVAFVPVGVDGRFCFTNSRHGPVDVVIDAMVVGDESALRPISPSATSARLVDTRLDSPVTPAGVRCVPVVEAQPGEFVGVNVTPVEATAAGFGTMHASGASPSGSSTVNFAVGTVDPNFAFVQVGADGSICFTNSVHATVDVIVDQLVVVAAAAMRAPAAGPTGARVADTRIPGRGPMIPPSASVCFGVPGAAAGEFVAVNLTPVGASGAGFGTLHAGGAAPSGSSNVNFGPGTFDPNLAMSATGPDSETCFTNSVHAWVDLVADAQAIGSPSAFRAASVDGSVRLLDTREARP